MVVVLSSDWSQQTESENYQSAVQRDEVFHLTAVADGDK